MKNVGGMRAYKVKWKCPISWLYPAELSYICLPLPSTRKYSIQIYDHYQLSSESAPSPTSETMASSPEVPSHWSQQPATQSVHLVRLQPSSDEFQKGLKHFSARGGKSTNIAKIERIQNPALYRAYIVKKDSMKGAENERQLFHGTREASTVPINTNNFNRSFSGIHGEIAKLWNI